MGPGDDAAVLRIGGAKQVITTDHLRGFTLDPVRQTRVAALHAMGDIWAMGADPQAALAQITLPLQSEALQRRSLAEIMATANDVFREAGAEIVGGHSTQGAELQIGFTVTGLLDGPPITTRGGRGGDVLLLTRPIGSGIILAAEMGARAPGRVVTEAWALMAKPQADAARILTSEASAMTDVTGFGLAGHLWEICHRSGLAADLSLDAVPIMPGALELSQAGVASTLAPSNRQALDGVISGLGDAREALLYDPQTAGGFLAAVPSDAAEALVMSLRTAGHAASQIGHLREGTPTITLI